MKYYNLILILIICIKLIQSCIIDKDCIAPSSLLYSKGLCFEYEEKTRICIFLFKYISEEQYKIVSFDNIKRNLIKNKVAQFDLQEMIFTIPEKSEIIIDYIKINDLNIETYLVYYPREFPNLTNMGEIKCNNVIIHYDDISIGTIVMLIGIILILLISGIIASAVDIYREEVKK